MFAALGTLGIVAGPPGLCLGHFSAESPSEMYPSDWSLIQFGDSGTPTAYNLVQADTSVVMRARSEGSAGGLITYQRVNLNVHPVVEWRWRVRSTPDEGDITEKSTDDAAARLYVTFDYDGLGLMDRLKLAVLRGMGYGDLPTRALNYVWSSRLPKGEMRPSPYTEQIMMKSVRSGSTRVGQWVQESQNVREDYREAFGEDPPPVAGVALMTDTDNTGGSVEAFYGDIVFRRAPSQ